MSLVPLFLGVDLVQIGQDCGSRTYRLDRAAINNYVSALQEPNPLYVVESATEGAFAPSLILHSEVYENRSWYLPNVKGFLHTKQEFDLFSPLMANEQVTTHTFVADRYTKRDRDYVVCESLVLGSDRRVCVRGRTHQSFLKSQVGQVTQQEVKGSIREGRRFVVGEGQALEELPVLERKVDMKMCLHFSGPRVNLHNNLESARARGFPTVLVQGMFSVCLLSELLTRRFGRGWMEGGKITVSLVNPVWVDEVVSAHARITHRQDEGARFRASLEVWCTKGDGTVTVVGVASALT